MIKRGRIYLTLLLCLFLIFLKFELNSFNVDYSNYSNSLAINDRISTQGKNIKNLAVFIKFSDSNLNVEHHLDDEESVKNANKIFNSDIPFSMDSVNGLIDVLSFKKYYERQSYGNLSITTEFFPKYDGKVVSYTDKNPIGYYLKYNENNPIGYKNKTESLERESELVNNAVKYIAGMVSSYGITANDLDVDKDGNIDAISFIIEGQNNLVSSIGWNDLLWSHKLDTTSVSEMILGKKVTSYVLLYAEDYTLATGLFSLNRGTYGTIIHEFGHMLGYMDLYRYNDSSSKPVGFYDIMGNAIGSNPQNFLTYYISEYNSNTNWHSPLPVINKTTKDVVVYKPQFIDKNEKRAVKIQFDNNSDEFFVVEYHDKMNTYESYSALDSGIIIYRVNEKNKYLGNTDGSNSGKNDHVYVFRPNETGLGAGKGDLSLATFNMKRKTFGKNLYSSTSSFDNQTIFFSDGSNSGIIIEVTGETSDSITFNVTFPETSGNGTIDSPYLIGDTTTFIYLMSINTKGKYYKLIKDLDFKDVTNYPLIDFEGNFDGNNKTISNINSTNSGVFNYVGDYQNPTKIENLNIENLNAYSTSEDYFGGFANASYNVTFSNVHLKTGKVVRKGNPINSLVSTGGFVGNVNDTTIIDNCSSNVSVEASKNAGGFIGINMNAKIRNSYSSGLVTGLEKIGGFIGLQAINSTYKVPENVYYNNNQNKIAVGGYANLIHDLTELDSNSLEKGIIGISILNKITLSKGDAVNVDNYIKTTVNKVLNYEVILSDSNTLAYENKKIIGKNPGISTVYIDIIVGNNNKMRIISEVVVNNQEAVITESYVLNFLGLTKTNNYVVGFPIGTSISDIKRKIEEHSSIILKGFTNSSNVEINNGVVGTGIKFTLNFNNTNYTYTIVIKGDVNGDGLIYATDYVKVRNHIMGKTKLAGAYLFAADINSDNYIYATDYVQIRNHIMGKKPIVQRISNTLPV